MFKEEILNRIKYNGGFINHHAHIDRAYTVNNQNLHLSQKSLKDKYDLLIDLKKEVTIGGLEYRMSKVVENQIEQGVTTLCTFLDFDEYSKDKPFIAFDKIRDRYKNDIKLFSVNQTLQGLKDKENLEWFNIGSECCDIVGGLPGRDKPNEDKHLDIVLKRGKELKKKVHIHVDQFNSSKETETELTLNKIIEHSMEGEVALIHCISLACHTKEYREVMYRLLEQTRTSVICCPRAWLDAPRTEELTPTHPPITPIDEMLKYNIKVGIGVDNISDLLLPFSNGNMYEELISLAMCTRTYDLEALIKIASNKNILV